MEENEVILHAQLAEEQQARLDAENRLQAMTIRTAVVAEAARANVVDPEDCYRLLDISRLRIGASGAVLGVAEAVAELVRAKPYLVRLQGPQGATPAPAAPSGKPGERVPGEAGREIYAQITGIGQLDKIFNTATAPARGGGVFWPKPVKTAEGGPPKLPKPGVEK